MPICDPAHMLQPTCPDPSRAEYGQAMTFVGVVPITTWHALSTSHKVGLRRLSLKQDLTCALGALSALADPDLMCHPGTAQQVDATMAWPRHRAQPSWVLQSQSTEILGAQAPRPPHLNLRPQNLRQQQQHVRLHGSQAPVHSDQVSQPKQLPANSCKGRP